MAKPHELRTWIRGHRALVPPQDSRFFFTAMPKDEFEQLHKVGATE